MKSQVNRCLNHVDKECVRIFRDVVGVGRTTGDIVGNLGIGRRRGGLIGVLVGSS